MSSFCLSTAVILRCVPLSRFQSIIILIPTVVEVVFTSSLVITLWNSGHKRHLLLTAEGWVYLLLSVFELLTHVLDSAQRDVDAFAGFDVTVGVASFLPLFFYCFFLYIYSDTELLPNAVSLPRKLGRIASLLLLILIPAIVGFNEVASFVGIERRLDLRTSNQVIIGFSSQKNWTLNLFFSSITLALITLFQVVIFLITGFRVVVALSNQRRFEQSGQDAVHMIKGVGWLAAGMKMGAIESVIGFAGGSFGIVITRRIFRLLGRAFLCFGVVKGVDEVEDFRAVRRDLDRGKSRFYQKNPRGIKDLISNPRLSTFQQLSDPLAGAAYVLPRENLSTNPTIDYSRDEKSPRTPEEQLRSLQDVSGLATFESLGQRVTVYRTSAGAPTLRLRLSDCDLPTPGQIEATMASRPRSWLPFIKGFRPKSSSLDALPPSLIQNSGWNEKGSDSTDQTRRSRHISAPAPPDYRTSTAQSLTDSSVVEIVTAPQRSLSQSSARARLYQASTLSKHIEPTSPANAQEFDSRQPTSAAHDGASTSPKNPFQTSELESPESAYPNQTLPIPSRKLRVVSDQSFRSLPDTLQAVRELADEFPGPPLTYNGQPVMGNLAPVSAWNGAPSFFSKRVRSSLLAVGNAIGLDRNDKKRESGAGTKVEDEESLIGGNLASRPPPGVNPQILVTTGSSEGGHGGHLVKPKPSFMSSHTNQSIDPFDDSRSSTPVQEIINRPTLLRPHPRLDQPTHAVSVPSTPENLTPISVVPPSGGPNSQRWKYDSSTLPHPPERAFAPGEGLPTTPVRYSSITAADSEADSRLSLGQVMLANATTVDKLRRPPSKIIWKVQASADGKEGQESASPPQGLDAEEVHRRQKSIDAAAHLLSNSIPWLKNPEIEEEERKLQEAMASTSLANRKPVLSRVKTVGSVDVERTTPTHTTPPARRSLRVEPIMIPPPPDALGLVEVSQSVDRDDVVASGPHAYP